MIKTEIIEKLAEIELAEAEDEIIQARCHLNRAWDSIKEDGRVETREEFKLLKESGISAIQELVQLVAMCNKAIESLDEGEGNGN